MTKTAAWIIHPKFVPIMRIVRAMRPPKRRRHPAPENALPRLSISFLIDTPTTFIAFLKDPLMRSWIKLAFILSALWALLVLVGVIWQMGNATPEAHGVLVHYVAHDYLDPAAELAGAPGAASRETYTVLQVRGRAVLALFVLPLAALWALLGWRARERQDSSGGRHSA